MHLCRLEQDKEAPEEFSSISDQGSRQHDSEQRQDQASEGFRDRLRNRKVVPENLF